MELPRPYELTVTKVEIVSGKGDAIEALATFDGRNGTQTARQAIGGDDFKAYFDCCRLLAKEIFAKEFRLNSSVDLDFELTGEDGITVWHTKPSTYLKMPLNMQMAWSCSHMQKNFQSFTSLGLVEMPSEFKLINGALPVDETLKLILSSMQSGIEFMGMLVLQRDQIDHDKAIEESEI